MPKMLPRIHLKFCFEAELWGFSKLGQSRQARVQGGSPFLERLSILGMLAHLKEEVMHNFSSLDSKLREDIEVTDGRKGDACCSLRVLHFSTY